MSNSIAHLAAIVTDDICLHRKPILYGARGEQIKPEDSGWQFHAEIPEDPDLTKARVWVFREVIEYEPSLSFIAKLPVGSVVWRTSLESKWNIGKLGRGCPECS